MKRQSLAAALLLLILGAAWLFVPMAPATGPALVAAEKPTTASQSRPSQWATPLSKPGLPNLHRVSADLYRCAQPAAEGFREARKMGIKTVVNLRTLHSDKELLGDTGLACESIEFDPWKAKDEQVVRFLKIVTDKTQTPVLVHCQHGADRTGTMCAIYRMAVCGWAREEAIKEMTEGGFGFHKLWRNLVKYLQQLDIDRIKKQAGLEK